MPDNNQSFAQVPESKIVPKKRARLPLVWIIPIVAAAAGVWIAVTKILEEGPNITIVFSTADGLEANKTRIVYDGLDVGTLTAIHLAEDRTHVIATAAMSPKAKDFLVKDTEFWVVKPRMSGLSVSGLGTLISGYYIGVQLGQSKESERNYVALESPPPIAANAPGRYFMLKTPVLGSLDDGTPIFFRQLQAGQVVSYELDKSGQFLNVKIFVQAPYDQYVTTDTRFWQASGIDLSLTANGLRVQTESLMSILAGGIAFETPATDSSLPPADANTTFTLFGGRDDAFKPAPQNAQTFVLVFRQSIRGLTIGAPVELGGITMGEVTQISPQWDAKTMQFTVPITISVDPERYGVKFINVPTGEDPAATHKRVMDNLVARGLRAQLKTGSLISGSLYVSFNFLPKAPPVSLDWSQNPVQLPAVSDKVEAIEDSIASLLENLDQTVTNADKLVVSANQLVEPNSLLIAHLNQTLASAGGTLTNADQLLDSANQLIEPNSELDAELNALLLQGGDAARSIRLLADYLERHPEALIRGKTGDSK
jgi:paraquat-inducible protein B